MEHLDAATLEEFLAFNKKFYVPNNATLVVAGDINVSETKKSLIIIRFFFHRTKNSKFEGEKKYY